MEAWGPVGQDFAQLLGVIMPLVAVPLTVMIFYLRAVREHQTVKHREYDQTMEAFRREVTELRRTVSLIERDFATKEEWLRESMLARQTMERLTESLARAQAELEYAKDSQSRHDRVIDAIASLGSRLNSCKSSLTEPAHRASDAPANDGGR